MSTLLAIATLLGALVDLVLLILLVMWMARILRAMESAARSLGAAQEHLSQIRNASINVTRHIVGS